MYGSYIFIQFLLVLKEDVVSLSSLKTNVLGERMCLKYINDYIRQKPRIESIQVKIPAVCAPDWEVIKQQMELIEESIKE